MKGAARRNELTGVVVTAEVVRGVNVMKRRRPVIPKLYLVGPYADVR